jgi:diacylglycerol kinase family enzyme
MGKYAYHGAFFHLLFGMKTYTIRIGMENGEMASIQSPLLAVCNSQYTGHNMRLSPRSNVQDGGLELLYTHCISAWRLLKLFLHLPSGDHLKHPDVRMNVFQSLETQIEGIDYFMVDGEIVNGSRLLIDVLPGALSLSV